MNPTLKKAIKHLLGRDLWIRTDIAKATRFYGSRYGGWALVKNTVGKDSVVYSFGIGEDASFDLSLIGETGCTVHGFDPTPKSLNWVGLNVREDRFVMHPWALGTEDGNLTLWMPDNPDHVSASLVSASGRSKGSFEAECRGLESVMAELGHARVDVLKMDIEGAEYGVIAALCSGDTLSKVGQLLVEFHHRMEGFTKAQTLDSIRTLRGKGFRIAWVSEVGHEVLFVRE
jgi:FkbM family methyltransferase